MNSEAKVARVLLADDHAEILSRTASALADEFEIVGSVANVVDLVKAAAQFDPDVVVLDITMPGLDGIEAARRLKQSGCPSRIIASSRRQLCRTQQITHYIGSSNETIHTRT